MTITAVPDANVPVPYTQPVSTGRLTDWTSQWRQFDLEEIIKEKKARWQRTRSTDHRHRLSRQIQAAQTRLAAAILSRE